MSKQKDVAGLSFGGLERGRRRAGRGGALRRLAYRVIWVNPLKSGAPASHTVGAVLESPG